MYTVFANKDDTDSTATTMTNNAALRTGSTITPTIPELVANTINQLSTNQTALMNQMAAVSYANVPPPPNKHYQPPIQQLTIPVQKPFTGAVLGGFNNGDGGGGRGGHRRLRHGGRGGSRNQCIPYANFGHTQGGGDVSQGCSGRRIT
jgi:hypothetical protein